MYKENMKRLSSVLSLMAFMCVAAWAHGDESHVSNNQDVVVKVIKVSSNVYMLQGRGGNVGAITGPDGILIVDDDYKAVSDKLRDALKELGSGTPRYIVNTHWHGDHTEGNDLFGRTGTIIAHENVRRRLLDPPVIFGQKTAPYASHALPILTYSQAMSLHFNGEDIKILYYPGGHTDGDSVIFFAKANVVHLGDNFFVGRFPFVDLDSGGSVQGVIANVASMIKTIPADAKLIPGHGPLATLSDLKSFHDLLVESAKYIQDQSKTGKTAAQIKATGLPDKFKEAGSGFIKPDMWIDIVLRSYTAK
jgi:cyclase